MNEERIEQAGCAKRRAAPACHWLNVGVAAALALVVTAAPGRAQDTVPAGVRIGLTYDRSGKPAVALAPVAGPNADSVFAIMARDLDFSDRLTVIRQDSGDAPTGALNYDLYAKLNAAAVVQATVTPTGGLHIAVHEVAGKRVALVMDLPLPSPALSRDWRHVVHIASDSVEWSVLGRPGIASTRIAYTIQYGGAITLVDFDGEGAWQVPGTHDCLSPSWDPTGTKVACNALPEGNSPSRIEVHDLATGRKWTTRATGNNQTAVFSPDGRTIVFSAGSDAQDLYSVPVYSDSAPRRLTSRRGSLNVSPDFSPDGRKIVFTSSILGHPEVYIMDADGSSADLLTSSGFGDDLYRSDPAFSPDGRRVAFQSRIKGTFQVMAISVADKSTVQLTSEGANESPSWAPDGRHIVFVSTRTGRRELWVLDAESSRARQLTHGGRAQNPAWSPRLSFPRQP
ncbi:MAG: PD40 domain-containing protein [Gemmatimonadaceae bacterium]|nr:PD40 domain-containing protein [Gemmatimonadaceae bacterium]